MLPTMTELAAAIVARQELPPDKGDMGPIGPQGKAGLDGSNGRNGDSGPKGDTGDRGPVGANGADGRNGADGKDGTDGDPGLVWRGPWVRNLQYWPDDAVEQDGSSYVCTVASRSKPPSGAWDLLAKRGATGPPGMSRGGGGGGGGGSSLTIKDEGTTLDTAAASIDFVGAGVTATAAGHSLTVTIPGGGGDIAVADGVTTVDPASTITFPRGAVSDGGGGTAVVNVVHVGASPPGSTAGYATGTIWIDMDDRRVWANYGDETTPDWRRDQPALVEVLTVGNLGGNIGILSPGVIAGTPFVAALGASLEVEDGNPDGFTHGLVHITTGGSSGTVGQVFTAQGDTTALWGSVIAALIAGGGQAAFVPDPATPEQIRDSLVAVGIMAAA